MSKYCLVYNGECHDYKFKPLQDNWHYAFYTGDILQGQIFKMTCRSTTTWSAVPKCPSRYGPYDGFATRMDAVEMILKVNGFRRESMGFYKENTPVDFVEDVIKVVDDWSECSMKTGVAKFSTLKTLIRNLVAGEKK
jgi:hypothetical protein